MCTDELHRAEKTHLRDERRAAQSIAHNAIVEAVERLRLSTMALDRPAPKVATAIHQQQLAIDGLLAALASIQKIGG